MSTTLVRDVAIDFFEERNWPTRDQAGRPQNAVVEQVDRDNPDRTRRLLPNRSLHENGVRQEDTLRVLPESRAGAISPHERLRALIVDQREIQALAAEDPQHIEVWTNADHAPTRYEITLRYQGVQMGERGEVECTNEHRIDIILPSDYPLEAPLVRWLTPIFHPNISAGGHVCLGVLGKRYLPRLGLAYLVRMLRDIAQYRNYYLEGVFNMEAARSSPADQAIIQELGGVPQEEPIDVLLDLARQAARNRIFYVSRSAP